MNVVHHSKDIIVKYILQCFKGKCATSSLREPTGTAISVPERIKARFFYREDEGSILLPCYINEEDFVNYLESLHFIEVSFVSVSQTSISQLPPPLLLQKFVEMCLHMSNFGLCLRGSNQLLSTLVYHFAVNKGWHQ